MGCLINFLILWWPWSQVRVNDDDEWAAAKTASQQVAKRVEKLAADHELEKGGYERTIEFGERRIAMFDHRIDFLNLCQAIYQCLPDEANANVVPAPPAAGEGVAGNEAAAPVALDPLAGVDKPVRTTERIQIWINEMRVRKVPELSNWYKANGMNDKFAENQTKLILQKAKDANAGTVDAAAVLFGEEHAANAGEADAVELSAPLSQFRSTGVPTGPGYVVQLTGYHFHNSFKHGFGKHFVQRTLLHNLQHRMITLPDGSGGATEIAVNRLGISHPVVYTMLESKQVESPFEEDNQPGGQKQLTQYRFVVQFAWSPQPMNKQPQPQVAQNDGP